MFYIRRERTSFNFAEFWAMCPPKFADFASVDGFTQQVFTLFFS